MSKIYSRVKAVIFDMDGVITNTMPDHFFAWKKVFAEEKIHVSPLDVYCREGQKGLSSVFEILGAHDKKISIAQAKALLAKKEKLFKRTVKQRFIPGARRFVRNLSRQGFCLALVTGTSRPELRHILPERLLKAFTVIVTGSDVKQGKPDPEPFLKALKKLRLKSREVMVIENAPFGITSAKAAGLRCFALSTSLPKQYLKEADGIFESFNDLESRIKFMHKDK